MSARVAVILEDLQTLLRKACHAPNCKGNDRVCPNQCSCRPIRKFKLNNETAICWSLANEIGQRTRRVKTTVTHDMVALSYGFKNLSAYHMSRGWENFFLNLHDILACLCGIERGSTWEMNMQYRNSETYLRRMRYAVNRLKREPR